MRLLGGNPRWAAEALTVPAVALAVSLILFGIFVALAGGLRHYRGVNETISSLLLNYIAIALMNHLVSGPMRDPAIVHRPSSWHVGDRNMVGLIPGMDVHWGLVFGIAACVVTHVLMQHTVFGFAARIVGGNVRAAGLLQRRHDLPDATVQVMRGIIFLVILASEPLYGRFRVFQPAVAAPSDRVVPQEAA